MFITTPEFLPQHRDHRQADRSDHLRGRSPRPDPPCRDESAGPWLTSTTSSPGCRTTPEPRRSPPVPADNTAQLKSHSARRRHELTRAKAIRALRELSRARTPSPSESSPGRPRSPGRGSTPQPDIRTEIQQLRDTARQAPSSRVPVGQRASDPSLRRRLQVTCERNRQLAEENRRLRRQLAEALGQLRTPGKPRTSITIGPS